MNCYPNKQWEEKGRGRKRDVYDFMGGKGTWEEKGGKGEEKGRL